MLQHYINNATFFFFLITTELPEQNISLNWRAFKYYLGKSGRSWSQKGLELLWGAFPKANHGRKFHR